MQHLVLRDGVEMGDGQPDHYDHDRRAQSEPVRTPSTTSPVTRRREDDGAPGAATEGVVRWCPALDGVGFHAHAGQRIWSAAVPIGDFGAGPFPEHTGRGSCSGRTFVCDHIPIDREFAAHTWQEVHIFVHAGFDGQR